MRSKSPSSLLTLVRSKAVLTVAALAMAPMAAFAVDVKMIDEKFSGSLGVFTNTGSGAVTWHFSNTCAAEGAVGHSAGGAARWGATATCANYGAAADSDNLDSASTSVASCTGNVFLEFNYFLNYTESSAFDDAAVRYTVGGGPAITVADNGDLIGNLVNNSTWTARSFNLGIPVGPVVIRFNGATADGAGNAGQGFLVDDVVLRCDQTTGPPGACNLAPIEAKLDTSLNATVSSRATQASVNALEVKLDTNLNATVSSRATQTSVNNLQTSVNDLTTRVDNLQTSVNLLEAKADAQAILIEDIPCETIRHMVGVIKHATVPTSHPCFLGPVPSKLHEDGEAEASSHSR